MRPTTSRVLAGIVSVCVACCLTMTLAPLPASAAADDDVPGVALPSSPHTGNVSRTSDRRDVFAVSLNAGERLVVSLTGADGTNFDTALYPPGTGSVLTGVPVADSAWDQYPEKFYFDCEVGEAGTYYLEVEAYAGAGSYTLEWAVQASPSGPDDDIPGVAMPSPSPVAGSLDAYPDADDVYAINLSAGERLTLTLDGAPGLDADLYVFRPTASGIYDDVALTGSATDSYPEYAVLDVGVGQGGTYYVDVSAASGSGTYSLDYKVTSVGPPPDDVPGVPLVNSPSYGSLDWMGDYNDVWAIYLGAGQRLTATLSGAAGTDFDLYLYEPGTAGVAVATPVTFSNRDFYPDRIVFDVPASGTYFIETHAYHGSGAYSLKWSVSTPTGPSMSRRWGADRYETAIAVSKANFASGSTNAVCLATGEDYPDALAASGLAGVHDAPVLLTRRDVLPAGVVDEIRRLGASKVFVIGGEGAVSSAVESALWRAGLMVERLQGPTRYETAVEVAREIRDTLGADFPETAFVVRGDAYPDALAVSPFSFTEGFPILLTPPDSLATATREAIRWMDLADVVIAGGAGAVTDGVRASISGIPGVRTVERVWGADRYETAAELAEYGSTYYWGRPDFVGVATGGDFPDALGGGAAAGKRGGVLLLTPTESLALATRGFCSAHSDEIDELQIFGGVGAVSWETEMALQQVLR